jgi:hypothetical protein
VLLTLFAFLTLFYVLDLVLKGRGFSRAEQGWKNAGFSP